MMMMMMMKKSTQSYLCSLYRWNGNVSKHVINDIQDTTKRYLHENPQKKGCIYPECDDDIRLPSFTEGHEITGLQVNKSLKNVQYVITNTTTRGNVFLKHTVSLTRYSGLLEFHAHAPQQC